MEFYEKHKEERDRFEILAFHDASVKTLEELDVKMKDLSEKKWKGKSLPFPILMDASGATLKAYGIRAFPTTLLIDPEGKLVSYGDEKTLEGKLGRK